MASTSSQHPPSTWPSDPISPVGYLSRKALPIKRHDAELLTRDDVQFDLLNHIFSDTRVVFTNQTPGSSPAKITFSELYVNALSNSTKCSKVLKDKMVETPAFAIEFAKISLLTNVGRINTTMAFFPEMKTALRTYHPVPSLQKTDGNAQDAPRIKNCLKAALLPSEFKSVPPSTPDDILEKSRASKIPPTSVVNLIFVLANHSAPLASVHFDGTLGFLDLFLPGKLSSIDRARAFLWLIFHYSESPDAQNPFHDEYSRYNPGKVPAIRYLSEAELKMENIDTPEEIEWGNKMSIKRNTFLQKLVYSINNDRRPGHGPPPPSPAAAPGLRTHQQRQGPEGQRDEPPFRYYVPPPRDVAPQAVRNTIADRAPAVFHDGQRQERTMLQQAWQSVMTSDPLVDSDEEIVDEHVRLDCLRRLEVINRLRGRSPTPELVTADAGGQTIGRFQNVESWD